MTGAAERELEIDIADQDEAMSQPLNPNAAEFVPVSPQREVTSPVFLSIISDQVISQSPKRNESMNNVDINMPSQLEFEAEIKSRPCDDMVLENSKCSNGSEEAHENEDVST